MQNILHTVNTESFESTPTSISTLVLWSNIQIGPTFETSLVSKVCTVFYTMKIATICENAFCIHMSPFLKYPCPLPPKLGNISGEPLTLTKNQIFCIILVLLLNKIKDFLEIIFMIWQSTEILRMSQIIGNNYP